MFMFFTCLFCFGIPPTKGPGTLHCRPQSKGLLLHQSNAATLTMGICVLAAIVVQQRHLMFWGLINIFSTVCIISERPRSGVEDKTEELFPLGSSSKFSQVIMCWTMAKISIGVFHWFLKVICLWTLPKVSPIPCRHRTHTVPHCIDCTAIAMLPHQWFHHESRRPSDCLILTNPCGARDIWWVGYNNGFAPSPMSSGLYAFCDQRKEHGRRTAYLFSITTLNAWQNFRRDGSGGFLHSSKYPAGGLMFMFVTCLFRFGISPTIVERDPWQFGPQIKGLCHGQQLIRSGNFGMGWRKLSASSWSTFSLTIKS